MADEPWLEGTEKHPQGRLFAPVGVFTGDQWALSPERWMTGQSRPGRGDVIAWHTNRLNNLPRYDDPEGRAAYDGDYGDEMMTDTKERPVADYGSAVGMHFGTVQAGYDRVDPLRAGVGRAARATSHPVRIMGEKIQRPSGNELTGQVIHDKPWGPEMHPLTGRPDLSGNRYSDHGANYSERLTDAVEEGRAVAYENDIEAAGSTSYRVLPEETATWSEDVLRSHANFGGAMGMAAHTFHSDTVRTNPHPLLVAAAQQGYEVKQKTGELMGDVKNTPWQPQLPFEPSRGTSMPPEQFFAQSERGRGILSGEQWKLHPYEPDDARGR